MDKRYYKIAGVVLEISGVDEFCANRMRDYETSENDVDVRIRVRHVDCISMPQNISVIRSIKFRTHATYDGGYLTYDVLRDGTLTALIKMNTSITDVDVIARDIEPLGGANLSVRKFNMLAEVFRYVVLVRGGMIFHCSALRYNNEAILFSAPSGTGKSTHTSLWCTHVANSEVFNDDSPAIMIENGLPLAYGTPWSGKSDVNLNVKLPIRAIVFLQRGQQNAIRDLAEKEAFLHLANQSFYVPFTSMLNALLNVQESVCSSVKMYKLACNISKNAVETVYNRIYEESL